jgi:hypothetical protein
MNPQGGKGKTFSARKSRNGSRQPFLIVVNLLRDGHRLHLQGDRTRMRKIALQPSDLRITSPVCNV